MTTWLLTGGAGYIGGHVVRALRDSGHSVIVLDDLSTGLRSRVPTDVPLVTLSVLDTDAVRDVLVRHEVSGVVHLAAKKAVGESAERPIWYYRENVGGMVSLLSAMRDAGVRNLVYSSSAAVYGTPAQSPVSEISPTAPESPYGETKLIGEWLVADAAREFELSWVALRYFNVAGAGRPELGDVGAFNLIPIACKAVTEDVPVQIFGTDYPTPDGSCVRDYIDVSDLAAAHVSAAQHCEEGLSREVFNVGRGQGASVLEVLAGLGEVIAQPVRWVATARRVGDPAVVVADSRRIQSVLGWRPQRDLRDMLSTSWGAWQHLRDDGRETQ